MRVGVTGGSGFIGKRLVEGLLDHGLDVHILSRKPSHKGKCIKSRITYFQGDLISGSGLVDFVDGVDVIFNCAGEVVDTSRMYELHLNGTKNLIDAVAGKGVMWVQLSSTGAYGPWRTGSVLESHAMRPKGIYEKTKLASDHLVSRASAQGKLSYSILRPSIVYGAEMPNQSLFSMLRMIEMGLFFYIGRAGASANYIHVDNVVDALIRCALDKEARGEIFNLSDYCTMEYFTRLMAKSLGVSEPWCRLPERPVRLISQYMQTLPRWPLSVARVDALTSFVNYPTDKIEKLLGYTHKISISKGIADLVLCYLRHRA